MTGEPVEERELRAARNQALFRALNETMRGHDAQSAPAARLEIACECADVACARQLEVDREEYLAVRGHTRRFIVLPEHVYADVEDVVDRVDGYAVVEKKGGAGRVAGELGGEAR